ATQNHKQGLRSDQHQPMIQRVCLHPMEPLADPTPAAPTDHYPSDEVDPCQGEDQCRKPHERPSDTDARRSKHGHSDQNEAGEGLLHHLSAAPLAVNHGHPPRRKPAIMLPSRIRAAMSRATSASRAVGLNQLALHYSQRLKDYSKAG